jgi:hypothetical protein
MYKRVQTDVAGSLLTCSCSMGEVVSGCACEHCMQELFHNIALISTAS